MMTMHQKQKGEEKQKTVRVEVFDLACKVKIIIPKNHKRNEKKKTRTDCIKKCLIL
jgi:hypothetical protein